MKFNYKIVDKQVKKKKKMETMQHDNLRYAYIGYTTQGDYAVLSSDLNPDQIIERMKKGVLMKSSFTIGKIGWGAAYPLDDVCYSLEAKPAEEIKLQEPFTFKGYDQDMSHKLDWSVTVCSIFTAKKQKKSKSKRTKTKHVETNRIETKQNDFLKYVYLGCTTKGQYAILLSDLNPEQICERNERDVLMDVSFTVARTNWGGCDDLERICEFENIAPTGDPIQLKTPLTFNGYDQDMFHKFDWSITVTSIQTVKDFVGCEGEHE